MPKVYYVECPDCHKEYYVHKSLYEVVISNPNQKLKCPFCKKKFYYRESSLQQ